MLANHSDTRPQAASVAAPPEIHRTRPRQVFILPTRFGLLFGGALLLMLLVSINYNNGLGHLFTFVLAATGVMSMYYTQRNLVGLELEPAPGRPVFAGERAHFSVRVVERNDRPRSSLWVRGGETERVFDLKRAGDARLRLAFSPAARGLHEIPRLRLVSLYPLGLFCAWTRPFESARGQLVYPRPAPPTALPSAAGGACDERAPHLRHGDEEFHGIREHRHGDAVSRIHWKHSARGDGLKTKEFSDPSGREIHLKWSQAVGYDTESRISCLCRWVLDAEAAALRYSLQLPGFKTPVDNGPRHRHRCLEALALWREPA